MKKSLLFGAALLCAASVNAQVYQVVAADHGITATDKNEAGSVEAGYVFFDDASVTIANAFTTNHITTDCKCNNYNQVVVDGNVLITNGGIQGQDNPKDADGSIAGGTLEAVPASGAVIEFTAKKDGYAYVFGKLSSNKNYYVFEEGTAAVFTLAMQVASDVFPEGVITYTAEGDEMGYLTDANWMNWPEKVALGEGWEAAAGEAGKVAVNGVGFIGFKIYEGCKYLVGAGGSKISWFGAYVADAPASSIVLQGTDEENPAEDFVLYKGEGGDDPVEDPSVEVMDLANAYFWNGGSLDGNVATFVNAWDGLAWWLDAREGINKIVVEYEEPTTILTQLLCLYNDVDNQSAQAPAGSTSLSIDLTPGSMSQFAIQNEEPGSIVIKSVTLYYGAASINDVKAENNSVVIYNLNGQKANSATGLQIRNGKVIMVK